EFEGKARTIGADPKISGVAERQYAGESQQEIHRHRYQPKDKYPGAEGGVAAERHHPIGREQQGRPDRGDRKKLARLLSFAHVSMPSSPSKPRGRIRSTTAISTYMIASLAAGRNTAVTPEATPI